VYFGGRRVAHRVVSGNSIYYYGEDFLGTSRQIFTSASALCYDAEFYPFGGERAYTTTCTPTYKFEGKERDSETSNDDFGARYYSSSFGRWTSPDWSSTPAPVPYANLTNPQTLNLYAMVSDNPETFVDLDGHFWRELLNYMKTGECYCDAAQMKAYVEQRRAWLTEHVVSLDGGKHRADFSKLTDDQVLHEYDFVTGGIEEGRYTVEGQPPNIPGTPVGDVPDVNWGPQEKHFEGHNS
jgi:RHS repeat-associated protein